MWQDCKHFIYLGGNDKKIFQERFLEFSNRLKDFEYQSESIFASYEMEVNELAELLKENIQKMYFGPETGIFIVADRYAIVLYQILYSLGIHPERDIKIISCDNNDYHLRGLFPRPPVVDIKMDTIGNLAAEMLVKLISQRNMDGLEKNNTNP